MLLKSSKKWQLHSNELASEKIYLNRREVLKNLGFLGIASGFLDIRALAKEKYPYHYSNNNNYDIDFDRLLTSESKATSYNNFYEFGSTKNIKRKAEFKKPEFDVAQRREGMQRYRDLEKETKVRELL